MQSTDCCCFISQHKWILIFPILLGVQYCLFWHTRITITKILHIGLREIRQHNLHFDPIRQILWKGPLDWWWYGRGSHLCRQSRVSPGRGGGQISETRGFPRVKKNVLCCCVICCGKTIQPTLGFILIFPFLSLHLGAPTIIWDTLCECLFLSPHFFFFFQNPEISKIFCAIFRPKGLQTRKIFSGICGFWPV